MTIKIFRVFIILLILSAGIQITGYSQLYFPEDMINIKGRLIDEITKEGIGYANVINLRIRGGTMSDANGNFSVQADPKDTLTFKSLSYKNKRVPVSEIVTGSNGSTTIMMSPVRILIDQVEVKGEGPKVNMSGIPIGKSVAVPVELRSDYFAEKPKVLSAIFRPLSFVSYHLSKSEKEKRTVLSTLRTEREWEILSLVYNKEVIQRISGFKGDALENFVLFCNAFNNLPVNANSYDVEKRIREMIKEYNAEQLKGRFIGNLKSTNLGY